MNTLALSQHSRPPLITRLATARAMLGRVPQSIFTLLFRVSVGAVFFKSGLVKIQSWQSTVGLFRDEYALPVLPPHLAAFLGTAAELICPVLIALGLFARLGAAALFAMTMVIQFLVYPENWAEHLMWAALLGFIISRGAGTLSLDAAIARHLFGRA
jgi:putative oxidoreductase